MRWPFLWGTPPNPLLIYENICILHKNTYRITKTNRIESRWVNYHRLKSVACEKSNQNNSTDHNLHRYIYAKVANIQHDIIQKLTTKLVTDYDKIVIEDLDVKKMQMSHVASKGLQRSMFGYFRQVLIYKCQWYGKELILADRFYPSTQRCSCCGHIKKGDERITLNGNKKHNTKHNEYVCYACGAIMDRDENAVMNLLALAQE